jgi:hypothetical protein
MPCIRGSLVRIGVMFATLCAATSVIAQGLQIRVDDPRPLMSGVTELERLCRCVITYEDPRWEDADVVDVTAQVRGTNDPSKPKVYSPAGRFFAFSWPTQSENVPAAISATRLRTVLETYDTSGNPGHFAASFDGAYHVHPREGSLLFQPITIPVETRSLSAALYLLAGTLSAATGSQTVIGRVPENLLQRITVRDGATAEPASVILQRFLSAADVMLSWRLLYDYGTRKYALNVHIVTR